MSLALMREAKRQRTGKAAADDQSNDWHVLIAAPSLTMTTVCYFGASIPCGGFVSEDEWTSFVEAHIAKRLESFTLSETVGYWKGCRERTYVLTVIHTKADDIADDCRIIADLYKKQFKQEAVLINTAQTAPILV